jgi:hypothetical protein
MAEDRKVTKYDVQPVENPDGTLAGLRIDVDERVERVADNGRVLDRGFPVTVNSIEIPQSKVADLVRDLIDWPLYYATGISARDARSPVSWPNSLQTWTQEVRA